MSMADAALSGYKAIQEKRMNPSDIYAGLLREQWDEYRRRYRPYEDELLGTVGNPMLLQQDIARSQDYVDSSFAGQAQSNERRLRGLGVTLDPQEQASYDKKLAVGKGLAEVDAGNKTVRRSTDRDLSLLTGGFLNYGRVDPAQRTMVAGV